MRRCKVDDNQPEIAELFQDLGATVLYTHTLGKGAPDIIVGYRGENFLVEIKDGKKVPSKQKLTPDEREFHATWNGQICIVKDAQGVYSLLRVKIAK
jgi:hypothetical protein